MMSEYYFDEAIFRTHFLKKDRTKTEGDRKQLTHYSDECFKLYPYNTKKSRNASKIENDLTCAASIFIRLVLNVSENNLNYYDFCNELPEMVEFDESNDKTIFIDIIRSMFFKDGNFQANNIGLYAYQKTDKSDKDLSNNSKRLAEYLYCVLGLDEQDTENLKNAEKDYPFNVLEDMVFKYLNKNNVDSSSGIPQFFPVKTSIQEMFKKDFSYMLSSGMTSLDDLYNLLSFYYFYYVSQCSLTLDQFCIGDREKTVDLYFALDWEKVSDNRKCCTDGWNMLKYSVSKMYSHAITLEILNQNDLEMMDYIEFKRIADTSNDLDHKIADEIKRVEKTYLSYIVDCNKFDEIGEIKGVNSTDSAIRHLFECVQKQFDETSRKRARALYSENFSDFCKYRFLKNRKKLGFVLNLTERDIIFLTKLSVRNKNKIRLNELYDQYELRGIYLDTKSKELLQEFFTKLNLIDKKSDSGDAQYVKQIL